MTHLTSLRRTVAAVLALCPTLLLAAPSTPVAAATPDVYSPNAAPFGRTYAQWSAAWWQWAVAQPTATNPIFDTTGKFCDLGQAGPVWFLAGSAGSTVTRTCTVPAGKAVLFPLVNYLNDYPCPDPSFQPAPGQSLEDFLTQGARAVIDTASGLAADVDGVQVPNPKSFRATSALFQFQANPTLTKTLDPCFTGKSQPGVSDGYWIMLQPLPAGAHTLHFHGVLGGTFIVDVTDHLTVQ